MPQQRKSGTATSRRRPRVPSPSDTQRPWLRSDPVAASIEALRGLGVEVLREAWRSRFRCEPPGVQSGDLLLRLFAWRLQAEAYGGMDTETTSRLQKLMRAVKKGEATSVPRVAGLRAGTVLIREWRGVEHRVLVLDGSFEHQGKRHRSLTQVARTITGTHWSGPRFFGLEDRSSKESPEVELPVGGDSKVDAGDDR